MYIPQMSLDALDRNRSLDQWIIPPEENRRWWQKGKSFSCLGLNRNSFFVFTCQNNRAKFKTWKEAKDIEEKVEGNTTYMASSAVDWKPTRKKKKKFGSLPGRKTKWIIVELLVMQNIQGANEMCNIFGLSRLSFLVGATLAKKR